MVEQNDNLLLGVLDKQIEDIPMTPINSDRTATREKQPLTDSIPNRSHLRVKDNQNIDALTRSEIDKQISVLSSMLMLEKETPPGSIAIIGRWGSGKSFFLERLQQEIAMRSEFIRSLPESDPLSKQYLHKIVQIEFNVWHYADTNLWASLAAHIFDKIASYLTASDTKENSMRSAQNNARTAMLNKMELTKNDISRIMLQKTQMEKEKAVIEEQIRGIQEASQNMEKKLPEILMNDAKTRLMSSLSSSVAEQLNHFLTDDDLKSLETLSAFFEKSNQSISLAKNFLIYVKKHKQAFLKTVGSTALITAAFLFSKYLLPDLLTEFKSLKDDLTFQIATLYASVTSGLASLGYIGKFMKKSAAIRSKILSHIAQVADENKKNLEEKTRLVQKESATNAAQQIEIEAQLKKASDQIQELESKLSDISSGNAMKDFLLESIHSKRYKEELGLINTIRSDFMQLEEYISEIEQEQETTVGIKRIILFIDDLDRCPPEKVVDMLSAINLLMSLNLFTVVAGIDTRWVCKCLENHYQGIFTSKETGIPGNISSMEYLEKIFQLPINIDMIPEHNRKTYIRKILLDEIHPDQANPENHSTESNTNATSGMPDELTSNYQNMRISDASFEDMVNLAPMLRQTPRILKRFVNSYRLIRARHASQTSHETLFLLALSTEFPDVAGNVLRAIEEIPQQSKSSLFSLIESQKSDRGTLPTSSTANTGRFRAIQDYLIKNPQIGEQPVTHFKSSVERVRCFTFHVEDLI